MNDQNPHLTPLFNRSADGSFKLPEDGWFHLVPRGRFPVLDPEVAKSRPASERIMIQVVDDRAVELILNRFAEDAKVPNFPGLLVDYDHFSYDEDKPSVAAGWVKELKNRADGIWGRIEWTPKGQQSLKDGEYRFVSPVWDKRDTEPVKNREIRPMRVETFGLVNKPNLRGMVPLSNRDLTRDPAGAGHSESPEIKMKTVSAKLGLQPDASEEAVLAAVTKLMNRSTELETSNETLTKENGELKTGQVELALDKYKNRFKAEKRDAWKNRLTEDFAGAVEILEEMPVIPAAAGAQGSKMLNRKDAKTPGENQDEGAPRDAKARAAKIESLVGEYKVKNRCSTTEAYDAVERSNPELFKQEEEAEA